ncbi:MAG: YaiO family outer membrane beta-barrel protein [Vulcanimicrobiaceae bacterium]
MNVRLARFAFAAALAAAMFLPGHALADVSPSASPSATPAPPSAPVLTSTTDLEIGGVNDQLTDNRGTWNAAYLLGLYRRSDGLSLYGEASQNQRFGLADTQYGAGAYVPVTKQNIADILVSYSPQHNVLPSTAIELGDDIRLRDGYGIQVGYRDSSYPSANVGVTSVGFDRYYGDDRIAYASHFAVLSNVPGVAWTNGVSWSRYLPRDVFTLAAYAGRDVENTGTTIATYGSVGVNGDLLHWMTPYTALHFGLGDYTLTGAYDRFEVQLGLRARI